MNLRALALLFLLSPLLLCSAPAEAQTSDFPLYETRASWVATSYRLDWPPFDPNASDETLERVQKLALRMIMENHRDLGMNTVVFQVFTHGTAFYDSERVPWSSLITGTAGEDPGWDPLAYAVEQAHLHGLELHAWFNSHQMGNPNTEIDSTHVRNAHPEWVKAYPSHGDTRDYWINPAHPDARDWLVGNVVEIVENYDIDAIHFDYVRYPGYGFNDDNYDKMEWPNGEPFIDDWRRENINMFVRDAYNAVKATKPWVKVGSAPIGTYKNDGTPGFWAWDHLYQASRVWLAEGVHDYLAPQLYFDIGEHGSIHHDFRAWLQDWVANSNSRHIYAGQGTWREVYSPEKIFSNGEIARQIDVARELGASGQVHFRYEFVNSSVIGGKYAQLALPPPMPWQFEAEAPTAPADAAIAWDADTRTITVSWRPSDGADNDPLRRYAVFSSEGSPPNTSTADDLVAILGIQDTTFSEVFTESPELDVHYAVVAQSQLGMVSPPSQTVSTGTTPLEAETPAESFALRITDVYPNPARGNVRVDYEVNTTAAVKITLYDMLGRMVEIPLDARQTTGKHHLEIDVGHLASGVYLLEMNAGPGLDIRRFVVGD